MELASTAWPLKSRRQLLKVLGITAGGWLLHGLPEAKRADDDHSFVLVQGDRCIPVTPLQGEMPVEEFYDYTYPKDEFEGPPGSDGNTFSSEGTTHLQRDRTSILFLYVGANGVSLVVVHGHLDGERDEGGAVSFTIDGLSEDGTWTVRDDDYRRRDGERQSDDRWDIGDDPHVIDWGYTSGRTDGGVFRGLGSQPEIVIEPAFNEKATRWGDFDHGRIESWEVLSRNRESVDRYSLRLDQPVTIQYGPCPSNKASTDQKPEKPDEQPDVVVDEETDENIQTEGTVRVTANVELDGNIQAGSVVELESDVEVDGNIEAGGDVFIGSDSEIDGNVEAGGNITVDSDGEIDGNVQADSAVTVGPDAEIDGNVTGASVEVADSAEIDGTITTTDG